MKARLKRFAALLLAAMMLMGTVPFAAAEGAEEEPAAPVQQEEPKKQEPTPAPKAEEPKQESTPAPKQEEPKEEAAPAPKAEEPKEEAMPAPEAEEPKEEPAPVQEAEEPEEEPETVPEVEEPEEEPAPAVPEEPEKKAVTIRVETLKDVRLAEGAAVWTVSAEASDGSQLDYQWQVLDGSAVFEDEAEREAAWQDLKGETKKTLKFEGVADFAAVEKLLYRCRITAKDVVVYTAEVRLLKETAREEVPAVEPETAEMPDETEAEENAAEEIEKAEETEAEEPAEVFEACALTEGCTLEAGHEGECVFGEAEAEFVSCTLTEGCILEEGHEGECVFGEAEADVPCTLTEGCILEEGHEGECVVAEPEAEPLPFGFKGMPEDYVLSKKQMAVKDELTAHNVVETVEKASAGKDYVKGEILFMAESKQEAKLIAAAYNAELVSFNGGISVAKLTGGATVKQAVVCGADKTLNIPAVEPNYLFRLDPSRSTKSKSRSAEDSTASAFAAPKKQTWDNFKDEDPFLGNPSSSEYQWQHDMVNSYEAWSVTTGSSSVKVGVIDTGVYAGHPDLAGKVHVREVPGCDTATGDHGTHVAGIIAATLGNEEGGAGIAPGVTIYSYNVFPGGGDSAPTDIICNALRMAADDGMWIINMSIGRPLYSSVYNTWIQYAYEKGCTIVAAMGNDGSNAIGYPAGFEHVIAVGAVDKNNNRAYFSNYGPWCAVSAPGVDILSAFADGGYGYMSGTSQATPVVSGVLALYMSKVGKVGYSRALSKLKASVNKCGSSGMGAGVVDAAKLFEKDKTKPVITVGTDSYTITSFLTPVPYDTKVTVTPADGSTNDEMLIWSVNKKPVLKNGQVTVGELYTGEIELKQWAGKTVTFYAACINGMGVMSTASSVKIKVSLNPSPTGVSIVSGSSMVFSGKGAQFKAAVAPADASQAVAWSITEKPDCAAGTQISAAGKLTAKTTEPCYIRVTATSKVSGHTDSVTVKLMPSETRKIELGTAKCKLYKGESADIPVSVFKVIGKTYKEQVSPDAAAWDGGYELSVSSSNPGAVTAEILDDNRTIRVTSLKKGTAKITVKLKDGNAASAVLTVTSVEPVESIEITAQDELMLGKSFTAKAVVTPSTATNKAVAWSVSSLSGCAKIDIRGKVTLNAWATEGETFTITATAKDGSGVTASKTVTLVGAPTLSVDVDGNRPGYYGVSYTHGLTGSLASATLFVKDLPGSENVFENGIALKPMVWRSGAMLSYEAAFAACEWKSSNVKVATVSPYGDVFAVGNGTATITCAMKDGSGVKKTVKVTVKTPASSVRITSSANRMKFNSATVAAGGKVTHKVSFGDGYGKPTTKAANVRWWYGLYYDKEEVTSTAARSCVALTQTGTLTVSRAIADYPVDTIVVGAYTTDGSNVEDVFVYDLVDRKTTTIIPGYKTIAGYAGDIVQGAVISNSVFNDFTITSSNPKVASYYRFYTDTVDKKIAWIELACNQQGTAVITVKANDGSGKYCTFTVKVY